MTLPQASKAVSGAAVSALHAFVHTLARGVVPISVNARRGASEPYAWYDVDLWTTRV